MAGADLIDIPDTFYSLSVVRVRDGEWQANLQTERGSNSFRVRHGATPSEAIAALFAPGRVPPCPVPLPRVA